MLVVVAVGGTVDAVVETVAVAIGGRAESVTVAVAIAAIAVAIAILLMAIRQPIARIHTTSTTLCRLPQVPLHKELYKQAAIDEVERGRNPKDWRLDRAADARRRVRDAGENVDDGAPRELRDLERGDARRHRVGRPLSVGDLPLDVARHARLRAQAAVPRRGAKMR